MSAPPTSPEALARAIVQRARLAASEHGSHQVAESPGVVAVAEAMLELLEAVRSDVFLSECFEKYDPDWTSADYDHWSEAKAKRNQALAKATGSQS